MENRVKAARIMFRANILFFASALLAILAAAVAVTANGDALRTGLFLGIAALILVAGAVTVYLHADAARKYTTLAKEEEARIAAEEAAEAKRNIERFSEDGLPGVFCREIRGYSPAQLRLILSEQTEEYTPEEFAFIKKVLAEREAANGQ